MIELSLLAEKRFAIILVDYTEGRDDSWSVVFGRAKIVGRRLFVDRGTGTDFPIPDDTHDRIKAVSAEVASILGDAEYFTMLTIGPKPSDKLPNQSSDPALASGTSRAGHEPRHR
jgi:hypothetical protein